MAPSITGLHHDDGIYAVLAKSLAEGHGYTVTSLPSSPAQTKYPFLYSYALSWVWCIRPSFPDNVVLLKLINFIALFSALLFAWSLHRHYLPDDETGALLSVLLLGTNVYVISLVRVLLTETLFLTLTLYAMWLTIGSSWIRVVLLALVSAASYLTRTSGVSVLVSAVLATAMRAEHGRTILFAMLAAVAASPWLIWRALHDSPAPNPLIQYYLTYDFSSIAYIALWTDRARGINILTGNARYLLDSLNESLLLNIVPGLKFVFYVLLTFGALRFWSERTPFLKLFVVLYVALVLGWPWHPGRFVLPLIPIVLLLAFCGINEIHRHLRRLRIRPARALRSVVMLPVAIVVLLHIGWFYGYVTGRIRAPAQRMEAHWSGFLETFAWIRENTSPDAVLASAFDPMYYLYTDRRGIRPWFYKPETLFYPYGRAVPDLGDPEEILRALKQLGVTHLVIDPLTANVEEAAASRLFSRLIAAYGTSLQPLFQSADGFHKIYALPHEMVLHRRLHGAADDAGGTLLAPSPDDRPREP